MIHESFMNGGRESYCGVVPAKEPNKGGMPLAEAAEERPQAEENTQELNLCRTPGRESGLSGLARVCEAGKKEGKQKFTAVLHNVSIVLLRDSFYRPKKQAAPGVDGVTWEEYGRDLERRLSELHGRIHRGAYRTQPSRRVWIPKADGKQRSAGVAALENKSSSMCVGSA